MRVWLGWQLRETPLIVAAADGHQAVVECLLEHGADVNALNEVRASGLTTLCDELFDGHDSIGRNRQNKHTPLLEAAEHGHVGIVEQLVDAGADMHAMGRVSVPPTLLAFVVKCIAERRLSCVRGVGQDGKNAFMLAAASGRAQMLKYLLNSGLFDVNATVRVNSSRVVFSTVSDVQ